MCELGTILPSPGADSLCATDGGVTFRADPPGAWEQGEAGSEGSLGL